MMDIISMEHAAERDPFIATVTHAAFENAKPDSLNTLAIIISNSSSKGHDMAQPDNFRYYWCQLSVTDKTTVPYSHRSWSE